MALQTLVNLQKKYTLAEFLALELPDEDGVEYELVEGYLVAKARAGVSATHGKISTYIATQLDIFAGVSAGANQQGTVYTGASSTLGSSDPNASWVEPDVCYVQNGRTPADFRGPIPVAPDIVVEVWSPSDDTEKIQNKIEAYQRANVRLIWSVYMLNKYVLVYQAGQSRRTFVDTDGELDGGTVLPGFRLAVSKLFS